MIFKKKQSVQKMIVLAIALLCLTGTGWGETVETVVGEYDVQTKIKDTTDLLTQATMKISFDGGKYYLHVSNSTNKYTSYIIGCQDGNGLWYVWKDTAWVQTVSSDAQIVALVSLRTKIQNAASKHTTTNQKLMQDKSLESFACEVYLSDVLYEKGVAAITPSSILLQEGGKLKEYLPDGSNMPTNSEGMSGDIVIGLYPKNGDGDGLVFRRRAGVFEGEAELFSQTGYSNQTYSVKALALQNEFFKSRGAGSDLQSKLELLLWQLVSNSSSWDLFKNLKQENKEILLNRLATMLGNGMNETYQETIAGKSVFGSAKGSDIARNLYGDRRDLYFDSYLTYLFKKNRPVFASNIKTENSATLYNPAKYEAISSTEGAELAQSAMKYYSWGVEYTGKHVQEKVAFANGNEVYSTIKDIWFTANTNRTQNYFKNSLTDFTLIPQPVDGTGKVINLLGNNLSGKGYQVPFGVGKTGTPLPYAKNGIDSPRTFAYKMQEQLLARKSLYGSIIFDNTTRGLKKDKERQPVYQAYLNESNGVTKPFLPGGKAGTLNEAGVDALGLLTGSIAMTTFFEKVYDLSGIQPAKNLDGYFAMKAPGIGLDPDGKPTFSKESNLDLLANYRLEAQDLEKCSVVVPDLSLIQLGDLIVRFGEQGSGRPTQIGIVVNLLKPNPSYRTDQILFMDSVVVLSVREGFHQVTMGTWGNSGNTFGGFTDEPNKCHVRRLLKRIDDKPEGAFTSFAWDVCDKTSIALTVYVNEMQESDRSDGGLVRVKERWIPNTGEYLVLSDVQLSVTNDARTSLNLRGGLNGSREVYIAGAVDRGYDGSKSGAEYGNIYNNSPCRFEVALVKGKGAGAHIITLGMLEKNSEKPWTYEFKYTQSDLYDLTGQNKNRFNDTMFKSNRLWIDTNSELIGLVNADEQYRLAIRPESATKARAGDDLLLQFGIRQKGKFKADSFVDTSSGKTMEAVGTMQEADYIAVYDKKMLWRANLYIDEGGMNDWNDVHPWNAPPSGGVTATSPKWWTPDWGNNEWNYERKLNPSDAELNAYLVNWTSTGNNPDTIAKINTLQSLYLNTNIHPITGNGGQVMTFHEWTRFTTNGGNVTNAVAYGWGAQDNPFEFDEEILEQKARIVARRINDNADNDPLTDYGTLPWIAGAGAPGNNWDNYLFPARYFQTSNNRVYFNYAGNKDPALNPNDPTEKPHKYFLPFGTTVNPVTVSIPGLSTFLAYFDEADRNPGNGETFPLSVNWEANDNKRNYHWSQAAYTSGIDCSGFVWRNMLYAGENYSAVFDSDTNTTMFAMGEGTVRSLLISPSTDEQDKQPANMKYAVPGDIIVRSGEHIIMILDVNADENGDVLNRNQITFIHAGAGLEEWQVLTKKIFGRGVGLDQFQLFEIRRLTTK